MKTEMTLERWLPSRFFSDFEKSHKAYKMLNQKVVQEYRGCDRSWPGSHRNVLNWCILENGMAVGWNENPGRGWFFPVIRMPK